MKEASITTGGHWAEAIAQRYSDESGLELLVQHFGALDHAQLQSMLDRVEQGCFARNDSVVLRKRLFTVMVEGLENAQRHTPPEMADTCFALLFRQGDTYRTIIGNALALADSVAITLKVELLNEMDDADLREHFLKLLTNEGRTERGGAGLGLLTLARKSTRPMVVNTLPRDAHTAYMALEFTVR